MSAEADVNTLGPIVNVASDVGQLVLYDPTLVEGRVKAPSSWWKESGALATAERREGKIAVWPLGGKGGQPWRIQLATGLDPELATFEKGHSEPSPLVIEGAEVFLGPVERLPGDGSGDRLPDLPDEGRLVPGVAGRYRVVVHVLDWRNEGRFYNEDNEPLPDAPPDFVLRLVVEEGDLVAPPGEPKPLFDHIPKKTPTASKKVRYATRPRPQSRDLPPLRGRKGPKSAGTTRKKKTVKRKVSVKPLAPGELGVGAQVRHPSYGVGTVLFVRDGFPKAKVSFAGQEHKVNKDDLTVLS